MSDLTAYRGRRRRSSVWRTLGRGLHAVEGEDDLQAWRLVLPESGRFTGLTAAGRYGWWVPPLPDGLPVFAAVDLGSSRPRREGLCVSRSDPLAPPRERVGLLLDSPLDVLIACARDLEELDVAVLAASAVFSQDVGLEELRARAATARRRGAPRLRRALAWVDGRAESPFEVLLATLHRTADVPVVAQHEVHDPHGTFVARADLWIEGTRRLPEYDGGVHLEVQQQREDLRRVRALNGQGWDRRGYIQHEVLRTPHAILRDADEALGREHDPSRLRPWLDLLRVSLFTPAGRAGLASRVRARSG